MLFKTNQHRFSQSKKNKKLVGTYLSFWTLLPYFSLLVFLMWNDLEIVEFWTAVNHWIAFCFAADPTDYFFCCCTPLGFYLCYHLTGDLVFHNFHLEIRSFVYALAYGFSYLGAWKELAEVLCLTEVLVWLVPESGLAQLLKWTVFVPLPSTVAAVVLSGLSNPLWIIHLGLSL